MGTEYVGDGSPERDDGTVDDRRNLIHKVEVPHASIVEEAKYTLTPFRDLLVEDDDPFREYRGRTALGKFKQAMFDVFPICEWVSTYKFSYLLGDLIAGLTIASLAVPQDLGYAKLANLPPVNGLYSSFVPPLIYAVLGSSRHLAIGPVSVVSLLLGNLLKGYFPPTLAAPSSSHKSSTKTSCDSKSSSAAVNPDYYDLAITATFFAGVVQAAMGIFRLGFVVDFLSHAVVVGFMAGAAITIGLQQLKGLLGYTDFTSKSDIVSVFKSVDSYSNEFEWHTFLIGICFLIFLLILKYTSQHFKKNKILFFANALAPLLCVIIATASVYGTKACNHGVKVVGHIKKGVNPSSTSNIRFDGDFLTNGIKVGVVAGLIALTEAVAIGRTFAALKGYHIDGNKEMLAIGSGNIIGSLTSCFVSTGSFSRSAVNFAAGANTPLTQFVMSIVLLITLTAITPLFKYLPNAVLSAIIIAAVSGLVNIPAAYQVWKTDKFDFVALLGAFFGVLFVSIEIGLLIAVCISAVKVLINAARPHTAILGKIHGTTVYRSITQYPGAEQTPGIMVFRIDAPLYFANANFIREKVERLAKRYQDRQGGGKQSYPLQFVILELTPCADIDTTGVHSLEELHKALKILGIRLGLSNPAKPVLWKLESSGFAEVLGQDWLFLSVHEGVKVCSMLVEREQSGQQEQV